MTQKTSKSSGAKSPSNESWIAFCDGASSGNPGPGGWAFTLIYGDSLCQVEEQAGYQPDTTNNRMELLACGQLTDFLSNQMSDSPTRPIRITIYCDSRYVVLGAQFWVKKWKRNGWKTEAGGEVLHQDLWEKIDLFIEKFRANNMIEFRHVDAHAGVLGNERVDSLAVAARTARATPEDLYCGPFDGYPLQADFTKSGFQFSSRSAVEMLNSASKSSSKSAGNSGSNIYYISDIDGAIERHADWDSCESRVKGRSGARFKKISSRSQEEQFLAGAVLKNDKKRKPNQSD